MNNFKKAMGLIAAAAMTATMAFGASAEEYALTEPVDLTFAAQEVGTAAYNYAAALQTVMMEELPEGSNIAITTTSPGGVGAPIIVNGGDQCDIVMSNSAPAKWSYEDGILGADATTEIACIGGSIGNNFINVMFTQKFVDETGITTVEELVEQKYPVKIVIKQTGTFGELACEKLFGVLGVTYEDIESWGGQVEMTSGDAIKTGLQDDLYDMTVDHIGAGQSNTTELCLTHDMYDVQLADETMELLLNEGFDYVTVPADTWNGQKEEIKSVGSQQCVLVDSNMSDALAYTLTKAIVEHKDELAAADASLAYFNPEVAATAAMTGAPLHPGAKAYYEENGYPVE